MFPTVQKLHIFKSTRKSWHWMLDAERRRLPVSPLRSKMKWFILEEIFDHFVFVPPFWELEKLDWIAFLLKSLEVFRLFGFDVNWQKQLCSEWFDKSKYTKTNSLRNIDMVMFCANDVVIQHFHLLHNLVAASWHVTCVRYHFYFLNRAQEKQHDREHTNDKLHIQAMNVKMMKWNVYNCSKWLSLVRSNEVKFNVHSYLSLRCKRKYDVSGWFLARGLSQTGASWRITSFNKAVGLDKYYICREESSPSTRTSLAQSTRKRPTRNIILSFTSQR